jgi:hypothetical protein
MVNGHSKTIMTLLDVVRLINAHNQNMTDHILKKQDDRAEPQEDFMDAIKQFARLYAKAKKQ